MYLLFIYFFKKFFLLPLKIVEVIFLYIYKIINMVNGRIYIGQTINDFKIRYMGSFAKGTHNLDLKKDIKIYGIKNFIVNETLDIATSQKELDLKEEYWIHYYDATNTLCGYNKDFGGLHGKRGEETKERIRQGLLNKHKNRKIKCISTGEVFNNAREGAEKYNIKNKSQINTCCNGKCKFCGRLEDGTKLVWSYFYVSR